MTYFGRTYNNKGELKIKITDLSPEEAAEKIRSIITNEEEISHD